MGSAKRQPFLIDSIGSLVSNHGFPVVEDFDEGGVKGRIR
jgi:hypothetical protein